MKNKYILLILILLFLSSSDLECFAVENSPESQDAPVVTKEKKKIRLFFKKQPKKSDVVHETPVLENDNSALSAQSKNLTAGNETPKKEIHQSQNVVSEPDKQTTITSKTKNNITKKSSEVKSGKVAKKNTQTTAKNSSDVSINSDKMEYFMENYELIATGNVVINMIQDGTKMYADKMVYNTDLNIIKGYGNVKVIKNGKIITGDFVNVKLNEENILVTKPVTESRTYKVEATEGYVYPGQIVTETGTVWFDQSAGIRPVSPGMGSVYPVTTRDSQDEKLFYPKEEPNNKQKLTQIKAKVIHIKSLQDHDEVSIKNASYYVKGKKIFTVPRIDLVTNKSQDFVETNLPELGSFKEYGSFLGPGFVANIPGGATLKLAPVFQIGREESKHDFGFGILGRFHSKNNITEGMWGTVDDMWIVRGQHRLTEYSKLEYAHDGYMDEWFMGMRMPEYLIQLTHDRSFYLNDIDATFRNRLSAGYVSDFYGSHLGTMRFRWQTETSKVLWSKWNEDNTVGVNVGLIGQTSAALYGTGDFLGVVKGGPFIGSKYKRWEQTLAYFQGAQAGDSPMIFDKYMYGKANLVLRETLAINKYMKIGYLGSLALLKDNWENKMFEENQIFLALGPDNFQVAIGYDPVRERVSFNYMLALEGGMELPYNKMIIDDATTLGKKHVRKKKKTKNDL